MWCYIFCCATRKDINSVFDALYSAVPSEEKFGFPSSTNIDLSELQFKNVSQLISLREQGSVIVSNEEHPLKAEYPILSNSLGNFISLKDVHWENVLSLI